MRRSWLFLYFVVALSALAWSGSNANARGPQQCAPWLGCSSCQVVLGNTWVKVNGTKELCNDRSAANWRPARVSSICVP